MTKPPQKKPLQKDYVQTALRIPPALRDEIRESANINGRSFNAEMVARLSEKPDDRIVSELAALRAMIQQLINRE